MNTRPETNVENEAHHGESGEISNLRKVYKEECYSSSLVICKKGKLMVCLLICSLLCIPVTYSISQSWSYRIDGISAFVMTQDGKTILAGSSSGIYYLFDEFGEVIGQEDLGSEITSVDISSEAMILGTKFATFILSLQGRKIHQTASDPVLSAAISENSSYAISGTENNILRFPSLKTMKQLYVETPVTYVSISPNGKRAAAATADAVYFFDTDTNSYWNHQISSTTSVQFSGNQSLIVGTKTGSLYSVSGASERLIEDLGAAVVSVEVGDDRIIAGTSNGVYLFDDKGTEITHFSVEKMIDCDISFDGEFIAAATSQRLFVFNQNGEILWQKEIDRIKAVEMSSDGRYVAVMTSNAILFFCNGENTFRGNNYYPYPSREYYSFENFKRVWTVPVSPMDGPYIFQLSKRLATGDVNGDGKNEIVFSAGKDLVVVDSDGDILSRKKYTQEIYYIRLMDLNNDTVPEIVYSLKDGKYRIFVVDARKEELEEVELDFTSYFGVSHRDKEDASITPVVSYDIDDDGNPEILAAVATGYALQPRGVLAFEYSSKKVEWFYKSAPNVSLEAFYDINNDGKPELILSSHSSCNGNTEGQRDDCHTYLVVLNMDGEEIWGEELDAVWGKESRAAVGDINNDGKIEIVVTVNDAQSNTRGRILVMSSKGEILYDQHFEYSVWLGGITDFNDDGFLEIVTTNSEGFVYVYNFKLESIRIYKIGGYIQSYVGGINDMDGDGDKEIIIGGWDYRVIILDSNLEEEWNKKFEGIPQILITNVSDCGNDLLILTDRNVELYSFEGEGGYLCGKFIPLADTPEPTPPTDTPESTPPTETLSSTSPPTETPGPRPFDNYSWLLAILIVVLAVISFIILKKSIKKREVLDLMILSLEKRNETKYQISLESVHGTVYPVRSARTLDISLEMRSEIIGRVEYTSKVITNYLDSERKTPLKKPTEELKKMGTVIYKNFIPRDFAQKLVHHYMILEVEDVQIPWELMYDDQFFALQYAISRRIKSEKVSEIHKRKRREKKALIIADPTGTLPEAVTECEYLRETLQGYFAVTYLTPEEAKKVDVMYHLSQSYDIIHYAGELKETPCLPVYKDVLTCAEIERTLEGSPVVFLNGCGSAKTFSYDIEGLAEVFLRRGALSYIGSLWSIHDRRAAEIAAEFYRNCLHHPVGEALRLSRVKYYSSEDITWAAFVMYGDPTLNLYR